ncbi:MAG: sodium:solute symporter family protein [Bacteroidales bacterium]|nr:sodium:solute symporter family protein [Bacteroidales bacterium]
MLTTTHIIGILLTIGILLGVSIISGRKVKDAKSFTTGGKASSWMVCGAILGTLVGGQSTIGTAQLAFSFGISAWWFTIGAALGAVALSLVYAGPIRRSGCTTLLEIVSREYGRKAETVGSVLFLIGIFISIMAQVLSSSAMMTSLFRIPVISAAIISALLIMFFVLFGGIRSAGAGGIIKLVLLYISSLAAGIMVWKMGEGISGINHAINDIYASDTLCDLNGLSDAESIHHRYGNMVARGPLKDLGGCLSLMLGVVTTQTYAQGIWSGASTPKARRGGLYCAFLIPFIGAACTLVGMYMRGHYVTADELAAMQQAGEKLPEGVGVIGSSLQAFPDFVINHLPDWLGGIALGAMLVNILGCGSGLVLGASTILVRDVYPSLPLIARRLRLSKKEAAPHCTSNQLLQTRLSIVGILALAAVIALSVKGAFINDLGFLSLGLRAVALLFPLSFALFLPGRFNPKRIVPAMIAGTATMLAAKMLALPADPVYYGLLISAAVILFPKKNTAAKAEE